MSSHAQQLNARLQRAFIHRVVERTRYENHALRTILQHWRLMAAAVDQQVRQAGLYTGTRGRVGLGLVLPDRQRQLQALLTTIGGLLGTASWYAMNTLRYDLPALVELEGQQVPALVNTYLRQSEAQLQEAVDPADLPRSFAAVPNAQLTELLGTPLGGAHFATSFGDLATTILTRLRNALLQGLVQGQSIAQVARQVRGVLQNARWQAERIVRSEFGRVANQAALVQMDANADLLEGAQWVATLDKRTCLQCAELDGRVWTDVKKAKVPVVDTHPNCRCTLVPVVREIPGLTLPPMQRASVEGPVPATLKYGEWFGEQSAALQREILGPTRYSLWASGRVALPDFVTARGIRSVREVLRSLRSS